MSKSTFLMSDERLLMSKQCHTVYTALLNR